MPTSKPTKSRQRRRTTADIIKAAKAAGAESVTFPDGTIVKLTASSREEAGDSCSTLSSKS